MGIKEELQKIIDAEREKLGAEDLKQQTDLERRKRKFAVLAGLLRELSDTLDRRYCEITIEDVVAAIFFKDYEGSELFISVSDDRQGFEVTKYRKIQWMVDRDHDGEWPKEFSTEDAVVECLLGVIGKKVAHLQHEHQELGPKLP